MAFWPWLTLVLPGCELHYGTLLPPSPCHGRVGPVKKFSIWVACQRSTAAPSGADGAKVNGMAVLKAQISSPHAAECKMQTAKMQNAVKLQWRQGEFMDIEVGSQPECSTPTPPSHAPPQTEVHMSGVGEFSRKLQTTPRRLLDESWKAVLVPDLHVEGGWLAAVLVLQIVALLACVSSG